LSGDEEDFLGSELGILGIVGVAQVLYDNGAFGQAEAAGFLDFVLPDGSKALRAAINRAFGAGNPVQRCRHHKIRNVCNQLPDDLAAQVKSVMKAAYNLPWHEGMAKLRKQADWLATHYPGAAASLREGLEETFTINRLKLSPTLRRCLGTTNIIESPHAGVRLRTNRVSRWQDGRMVLRWVAAAFLATEKNCRRILG
jgi:putative transposase